MPLQTFNNLPQERKNEILKASYQEFAFQPYNTASLSNIIKCLGIAKGSFYRYFENKFSLYEFLVNHAYELRMEQLGRLLENKTLGFFEIISENFRNKILLDIKYPLESIFLFNVLQEGYTNEIKPVVTRLISEVMLFTQKLIEEFQQKGELNSDISTELAAHFIFQSQYGIYEYLSLFKGINFKESIRQGHLFTIPEEEIMEIVNNITAIIKSGLKSN